MRLLKKSGFLIAVLGPALLGFSACSSLPGQGPSTNDVMQQQASVEQGPRYEVVDIDAPVVEALRRRGYQSFSSRFGDRRLSSEPVIGVGDSVSVTIWEASAGGLFSAPLLPDKLSVGSNSAMIPEQVVGRDGGITVPYAGRIHVAGQTTRAVQRTIEKALAGKAIEPQVLVNVVRPVSDSVSVVGEVTAGSRIPLSVRGDRLLDVIAEAGGVKAPVNETFVELTRGSATARMPLTTIIASPGEDVYLHPNDVLTLVRDPQTFIAYGATGRNAEIPFDADGINLAQALAKAGGLLDDRSDPRGVFIFRFEPESVLRAIRPDSPLLGRGRLTQVVYRLNLSDPNSLFLEQGFHIANRDVIYVSNSPSTEVQKALGIVAGTVLPPVGAASSIYSAAK